MERRELRKLLEVLHDLDLDGRRRLVPVVQPRVILRLLRRHALVGVHDEQALNEVDGVVAHAVEDVPREFIGAALNLRQDRVLLGGHERRPAAHEHVGDDADGPHVALFGVVPPDDLRRHVERRAHGQVHVLLALVVVPREPEVDELDLRLHVLALEEEVLELEVAVHDVVEVQVAHGAHDLLHERRGGLLVVVVLRQAVEPVQELAALAVLHDEPEVLLVREALVEPHNVRVVQLAHDCNLVLELLELRIVLDRREGQHLHGELLARVAVPHQAHHPANARAQDLTLPQVIDLGHVPIEFAIDEVLRQVLGRAPLSGRQIREAIRGVYIISTAQPHAVLALILRPLLLAAAGAHGDLRRRRALR
mmetsp:Transcript_22937/g.71285  ORF Transcript_22937/g.71285 Transcript_22937/m.71285 type:complete len:365 (-) Transcript_22937:220-1314(-)